MALDNEKPLEGWKTIASYLGRSRKTAERWEKQKGLPIHRNGVLGVMAYPSELDAWLAAFRQRPNASQIVKPAGSPSLADAEELEEPIQAAASLKASTQASGLEQPTGSRDPLATNISNVLGWLSTYAFIGTGVFLFLALTVTVWSSAYFSAMLAFAVGAVYVVLAYTRSTDTLTTRTFLSMYMTAAMAYICSASTMPEFQATVINAATLRPAALFLIVIGLKFVPMFILVFFYWVIFGASSGDRFLQKPPSERRYTWVGIAFFAIELLFLKVTLGDDHLLKAGVPGRGILLIASAVVLAGNLAVWLAGRHYLFRSEPLLGCKALFGFCAVAYLVVAAAAHFVDHEHNLFNRYYLDVRWPEMYVARDPGAIANVASLLGPRTRTEIGSDFSSLMKDDEFKQQLTTGRFYKQHSDEAFQLFDPVVMFAYKRKGGHGSGRRSFVSIRFPKELANALRFEPVSEEK